MTLIDLANPTKFLNLTARILPWLAAATAILLAIGLYQSAMAPDDYQQGATVKIMFIHVPNAWLSMLVWGVMSLAALGTLVWRHPLADVAAKAAAPIGAAVTFLAPGAGSLLGTADVGHLLGMGRAADLGLDFVSDVSRPDRAMAGSRRSLPGRARRGDPDAGRRDQSADHQILGGLVEYAAPASLGDAAGRTCAGPRLFDSTAGDGLGVFAVVRYPSAGGDAQRDPAPPGASVAVDASCASRPEPGVNAMSLGPYASFIVTSYLLV